MAQAGKKITATGSSKVATSPAWATMERSAAVRCPQKVKQ
jgi:hypothetical protein